MVNCKTKAEMYEEKEHELILDCAADALNCKMEFWRNLLAAECFWMYENNVLDIDPHNDLTKEEWQALAWYVRPMLQNLILKNHYENELFQNIYLSKDTYGIRKGNISYNYNPKLEVTLERMVEAANTGEKISDYKEIFIAESGYEPDWSEELESVKPIDTKEDTEEAADEDKLMEAINKRKDEDSEMKYLEKIELAHKATKKLYSNFEPKWDEVISRLLSFKDLHLGEMMDKDTIDYKNLMVMDLIWHEYDSLNDRLPLLFTSLVPSTGNQKLIIDNITEYADDNDVNLPSGFISVQLTRLTDGFRLDTAMVEIMTTSFKDVVKNIIKNDKPGEFYDSIQLPLLAISKYTHKSYPKSNLEIALADAMFGNYDKAISTFDNIYNFIFDNAWAYALEQLYFDNTWLKLSKEDLKGAVNFCKGLIYESQRKPMEAYAMYHSTIGSRAYKYAAERECLCLIKIGMWGQACTVAKKVTFWTEMTKSDQLMLLMNFPLLKSTHTPKEVDAEFNCPHDNLK